VLGRYPLNHNYGKDIKRVKEKIKQPKNQILFIAKVSLSGNIKNKNKLN
jgi:hypothetical protein